MKGGKHRGWTAEDHAQLVSLWGTGLSTAEVGFRMGRTEAAVRSAAKRGKLGPAPRIITPKPKSEPKPRHRHIAKPKDATLEPGFPKYQPCIGGCGRTIRLKSRNDMRKCARCHINHAEYSHLEGIET